MKKSIIGVAVLFASLSLPVLAQSVASETQRDVNQQRRIENGLQSGQLNTREAARLEAEQSRISRAEANSLKDGKLSAREQARIKRMQNHASRDIYAEKHDAQHGNPNAVSSKRMQADVARNLNQEKRIRDGVADGSLTNREASRLQHREVGVDSREAAAGRDGHVGAHEQVRMQGAADWASNRIFNERHDAARK